MWCCVVVDGGGTDRFGHGGVYGLAWSYVLMRRGSFVAYGQQARVNQKKKSGPEIC